MSVENDFNLARASSAAAVLVEPSRRTARLSWNSRLVGANWLAASKWVSASAIRCRLKSISAETM